MFPRPQNAMNLKGKKLLCDPPAMAIAAAGDDDARACMERVDEMVQCGDIDTMTESGAAFVESVIAAEATYMINRRAARDAFMVDYSAAVAKFTA